MINVSEIKTTAPEVFKTDLQKTVYKTLSDLKIPYQRVDTDEVITMEDCRAVDEKLSMKMVKTLFLCNRKQTEFYLFITCGDKPFSSKNFARAMDISRMSFAPAELMQSMMGTKIGAATVFGLLNDKDNKITVVLDEDVLKEEFYGCSDGTTTGYMKIKTEDIYGKFLKFVNHRPVTVKV